MPIITALETQKRDPERVNVFLDGQFAFGASLLLVTARELRNGLELTAEEVASLQHDDETERAYGSALNFLSFRPRSRREVEEYFRRKKTEPTVAIAVVERLIRARLLDDREFAQFWVENRQRFRPRGARALRVEMRQKGLDSDVIADTLEEITDEEPAAYAAAERKARSLAALDEHEFFRKLVGFLQRRGFNFDTAAKTARKLREELNADPP